MGERVTGFNNAVVLAVAETVQLVMQVQTGSTPSIASLPTAPPAQAAQVRIRGTLILVTATGGAVSIRVRRGPTLGSTPVGATPLVTSAAFAIGQAIPFEIVDTVPVSTMGLSYAITTSTVTSAGTAFLTAEVEVIM